LMLSTARLVGARPARAGRVGVPRRVVLRCRADATQGSLYHTTAVCSFAPLLGKTQGHHWAATRERLRRERACSQPLRRVCSLTQRGGERAGEPVTGVKLLAAGLAAAALLNCAPASAGVVFDKKPNVKKARRLWPCCDHPPWSPCRHSSG